MKKRCRTAKINIAISLIIIFLIVLLGNFLNTPAYDNVIKFLVLEICGWSLAAISLTLFIVGVIELTLIRREQSHKEIE